MLVVGPMRGLLILSMAWLVGCANPSHGTLSLTGSVAVEGQADVSGILVSVVGVTIQTTRTNAAGAFAFAALPPGHYHLSVLGDSSVEARVDRDLELLDSTSLGPLALSPCGSVEGFTAAGALVLSDASPRQATADAAGRFALTCLPIGAQGLVVVREGHVPAIVPTVITWRKSIVLPPITLQPDPTDLAHLTLSVTLVGTQLGTGIHAHLEPGGVEADAGPDGTLVLGPLSSGLYRLALVHPHAVLEIPRLLVGNGQAFVIDGGLAPLGPQVLQRGRRVAPWPSLVLSPRGRFAIGEHGIVSVDDPSVPRFDGAGAGLVTPEILGFLADDSYLLVSATSTTTPGRRAFYRVGTHDWQPEWLRDADETRAVVWTQARALLVGDRPSPTSSSIVGQLVYVDDKRVAPLGALHVGSFYLNHGSPSGAYHALVGPDRLLMVQDSDGALVAETPRTSGWFEWHPYLDLLLFHSSYYGALGASGELDFEGVYPSGLGWASALQPNGLEGLSVLPTHQLFDAARQHGFGATPDALVERDLATGQAKELRKVASSQAISLYDGERRLAYAYAAGGDLHLATYDRVNGTTVELGALLGQPAHHFAVGKQRLVFIDPDGSLFTTAYDGSDRTQLATHARAVSLHAEGATACYWRSTRDLFAVDVSTGKTVQVASEAGPCTWATPTALWFARSGSTLAAREAGAYIATVKP